MQYKDYPVGTLYEDKDGNLCVKVHYSRAPTGILHSLLLEASGALSHLVKFRIYEVGENDDHEVARVISPVISEEGGEL